MFKDTFISVKDNIVKKVTNPFLSTFVGVWIVRNWELVYSIFFFDESYSLEMRLTEIESYFADYSIWDVAITILITFGILISTFVLLSVSRLIVNFFDKVVTPKLYKWTDKNSIVLKQDYQVLESEISRLENRYQKEKETRLALREENERLEKRIGELISVDSTSSKLENEEIENKINYLLSTIKDEGSKTELNTIIEEIKTNESISSSNSMIRKLQKYGAVKVEGSDSDTTNQGYFYYSLTDFGEKLADKMLFNQ